MKAPEPTSSSLDYAPGGFFDTWQSATRLCYIWIALPLALLVFFISDGWTAWRLMQQGYEQTTGVVSTYTCGKHGQFDYTYYADKDPQHNVGANPQCHRYEAGETVKVYYSRRHPELAVANNTPGDVFRQSLLVSFLAALLMPILGGLGAAMRSLRN